MAKREQQTAVIYTRVSGKSQLKGKDGFRRQGEACLKYAKANGILIVGEYFEKAISGTKGLEERPAFQEMLSFLLSDGCKTIIVESLDRLAREYRIQEQILIYLSSKGLSLIAANTGEDITAAIAEDPMKKALIQIQGIFAELDKSQLVRKLRKSRETIRNRGEKCEGVKRFGEFPGEADTLKRLKSLYRKPRKGERRGYAEIARLLNQEGRPTRSGVPWTRQIVYGISKKKGR